ncbi:unnamed protein product [Owenia fusiformis]|uniref:G-protein coupled receptors family 3 profile domain-containing protein n=1 Tax=Owenia fusiformis TaxID=6347 RepID=A0A8S4NCG2_OWEFU|nr:unnamed protein product [Owenia fusiformis]
MHRCNKMMRDFFDIKIAVHALLFTVIVTSLEGKPSPIETIYKEEGDVNLAGMFSIHTYSETETCGDTLRDIATIQNVEAMVFAIHNINENTELLPNLTLGYVIVDDCSKDTTALGQAMRFMPKNSQSTTNKRSIFKGDSDSTEQFFDVAGVIGPQSSSSSMMVASVLNWFHIPQISYQATSDSLSDKNRYPYFLRMAPPDKFQVEAIVDLLVHFNWTFVSTVNSNNAYGRDAINTFKILSKKRNICIATSQEIRPTYTEIEYDYIVKNLLKHDRARAIVVFSDYKEATGLLEAASHLQTEGHFAWIGSEGWGAYINEFDDVSRYLDGAIVLKTYSKTVPEFNEYFKSKTLQNNLQNPWWSELSKKKFNCTVKEIYNETINCPHNSKHSLSEQFEPNPSVSTIIDSVHTFANALHALIENCHVVSENTSNLEECTRGEDLLRYIRNISFPGINGQVSFDNKGDAFGKYEILFMEYEEEQLIQYPFALWDSKSRNLTFGEGKPEERLGKKQTNTTSTYIRSRLPYSSCSEECPTGHIYLYLKDTCCWECVACSVNEITTFNQTRCETCPLFYWPNQNDKESCDEIPPTFIHLTDPLSIVLITMASVGFVSCMICLGVFIVHNDVRLIKSTSRELSYIMLLGTSVSYLLVFTFLVKPTLPSCYVNHVGFNMSFTLIYAPLITRTNRIYRIFRAGKKTKKVPLWSSPRSQVFIAMALVGIQAVSIGIATWFVPPEAQLRMRVVTEKFVELLCTLPMQGLLTSLCYNLVLISACSFYAFKTRTLPDNFNESRYIALCVYTTLLIWLAFIPTYFTTSKAYYQVMLLSLALTFNATVTLICLYLPKVFALYSNSGDTRKTIVNTSKGPCHSSYVHLGNLGVCAVTAHHQESINERSKVYSRPPSKGFEDGSVESLNSRTSSSMSKGRCQSGIELDNGGSSDGNKTSESFVPNACNSIVLNNHNNLNGMAITESVARVV